MGIPKKTVKGLWKIKLGLNVIGRKQLRLMEKASKNCKKAQKKSLRDVLEWCKDTVYGKEHNFAEILKAKTPEELFALYAKNVPINQYEALEPYIERHKNGERDILFPGKPKLYCTTSGTTNKPKWLPFTQKYYDECYSKLSTTWIYLLMRAKPAVYNTPSVSIVGPAIEGAAPDGTLYGSASGCVRRDLPDMIKVLHTAPADVFEIKDYNSRYYTIMRLGIEVDAGLIITANPSTLCEMQTNASMYFDDYVDDIEHGTLSSKIDVPEDIRKAVAPYIKPNPERAAFLRDLRKKYGNNILPKHYWPNLQVVNTWKCGNTKVYFDKLKNSFPEDCAMYEFTYLASEARFGLVLSPDTDATTLFGNKQYFEFIPEEDIELENPRILQLHELQLHKRYCLLLTTSSGLYRYNMNDLLEVTEFHNQFPGIQFIQKINGIITLTGEKLHEQQFIQAVNAIEKETKKTLRFFIGFAEAENSAYRFYYEFLDQDTTLEEAKHFTELVDKKLKEINIEYEAKRDSLRLKDPQTELLGRDAFEHFKAKCIQLGMRDGQFKLNLLLQDKKRQSLFDELRK